MISIHEKKIETLFLLFKKDIEEHATRIATNLNALLPLWNNPGEIAYLQYLIGKGKKLITGSLSELQHMPAELNALHTLNLRTKRDKDFRNAVLTALEYSKQRSDFYPGYFRLLGIKSCIYCNAQLCITAEDEAGNAVAKFQVDHHIAKDRYPGLSVMLLNLVPACSSCNVKKSNKRVNFSLYAEKEDESTRTSPFSFEIKDKDKTLAAYLNSRDSNVIKVGFKEPTPAANIQRLNQTFAIEGIYDTQKDIVEEMIMKMHIYDASFKKELLTKFKSLFKDEATLNRMIVGNYVEEKNIHRRPMSKFMQDIARQLGLISKTGTTS